jgi:pimeloyl-ACP methyl ester carboxylesterase
VIAGYDIGSRTAQAIARTPPDLVSALVLSPRYRDTGDRILSPHAVREFWFQAFHGLDLCTELIDSKPDAVRAYLRRFWSHWSRPGYEPAETHLDHLVSVYGQPGAFAASIAWYRAGGATVAVSLAERVPDADDRIAVLTTVLWPDHDPLFRFEWSDRIGSFFTATTLRRLDGAGHFTPLERPQDFAAAVAAVAAAESSSARSASRPLSGRYLCRHHATPLTRIATNRHESQPHSTAGSGVLPSQGGGGYEIELARACTQHAFQVC